MIRSAILIAALTVIASIAPAQTPLTYDAASVKPHAGSDGNMMVGQTADGFRCVNCKLKLLIGAAYDVRDDQIAGGPDWAGTTGYDVDAKVAPEDQKSFSQLKEPQKRLMLQAILQDRFALKTHKETRTMPVFDLVVASKGAKMTPLTPDSPEQMKGARLAVGRGGMAWSSGELAGNGIELGGLADVLANQLHRSVIDKTSLTGKYIFDIKYSPMEESADADASSDSKGPSLFTALEEQLGLRLVPSKGPVDIIHIDFASQPSAN